MRREAIAIIGEGITEKCYINSLKGICPFNILPQQLGTRASSLKDLEKYMKKAIEDGYDRVYCLIDMDGKTNGKAQQDYRNLKQKLERTHIVKKKEINCKVKFIETERCTELWFLFHFMNTTKQFSNYDELEKELKKHRPDYEKTEKYFRSINGDIHKDLTSTKNGKTGSLKQAIANSKSSLASREKDERTYTYSELHILIEELQILDYLKED